MNDIAYDMDGTLVGAPFRLEFEHEPAGLYRLYKLGLALATHMLIYPSNKVIKNDVETVITGRYRIFDALTMLQLKLCGYNNIKKLYSNSAFIYSTSHITRLKSTILLANGYRHYVDDDVTIRVAIYNATDNKVRTHEPTNIIEKRNSIILSSTLDTATTENLLKRIIKNPEQAGLKAKRSRMAAKVKKDIMPYIKRSQNASTKRL